MPTPSRRTAVVPTLAEQFATMRADYDAAKNTRFKRRRTGMLSATGSAADYHYRTEQWYFGIIEQARELFRNHCLVAQGIRRLVSNILAGGFTLDVRTGDTGMNRELSARWYAWAEDPDECDLQGEQDFHGLEKLTLQQVIVDGDLVTLPTDSGHLQHLEAHRLRSPAKTVRNVVHGVELDAGDQPRRRLAYWIAHEDVEQYYPVPKATEMTRYPARVDGVRQVLHHYMPDRTSQTRGVTCLVAPMETAGMGDDLMFAQLVKAQMAAAAAMIREISETAQPVNWGAGIPGQDASTEQRPTGQTRQLGGWQPGMEIFGFPGERIRLEAANVPNAEFFQHAMLILSIVAVNLDLPVQLLMLDATHTNFSGWRGSIDQARQRWLEIQRWLISSFHTPVYLWKVRQWAAEDPVLRRTLEEQDWKRRTAAGGIDALGHVWHNPGWPYIEPTQDATGDLIQIRNGLTSPRRAAARRGVDIEDLEDESIEDRIRLISKAQDAADSLNQRHKDRPGWVDLSWRDIAQPPMPEGIQISVASGAELGAKPEPAPKPAPAAAPPRKPEAVNA